MIHCTYEARLATYKLTRALMRRRPVQIYTSLAIEHRHKQETKKVFDCS